VSDFASGIADCSGRVRSRGWPGRTRSAHGGAADRDGLRARRGIGTPTRRPPAASFCVLAHACEALISIAMCSLPSFWLQGSPWRDEPRSAAINGGTIANSRAWPPGAKQSPLGILIGPAPWTSILGVSGFVPGFVRKWRSRTEASARGAAVARMVGAREATMVCGGQASLLAGF
jgi:hypothetical protein